MKIKGEKPVNKITMNTNGSGRKNLESAYKWWLAVDDKEMYQQVLDSAAYLKRNQEYRQRQAAIYSRLYGNMSLYNFMGANMAKMDQIAGLPSDRPTFNIIQSAADTLISRISQARPSPVFLTDNSDYKERRLAKQLNNFIQGEFYQTKTYEKAAIMLRDALVLGDGIVKVYRSQDDKASIDRVMATELLVDANDGIYGEPRSMIQLKLVDREVLMTAVPKLKSLLSKAEKAFPDNSMDSGRSTADQIMVAEAWHLPSGKDAKDGRHVIVCSAGIILDEPYEKEKFPFVFLHYSERLLGFWAQGLAEQLMGTQMEINSLLYTISRAIKLVGVPRVFVEDGSKVVKAHLNNEVGSIVTYRGTKPSYEVAPCNAPELYQQLQRMIDYGYQQSGVSSMQASAQKPSGLDSGEAIRTYDDISNDRFNRLARKYDNIFIDLAYAITDVAMDIAKDTGKYQTVYPNKNGTKQIDLPKMTLLKDPFVIQVFNMSSLPRDPAGRMQKITEMIQAGMITIKEGRRLLDYPDLEQSEKLANASEERIFQILDEIVEDGKYTPPDPFMDLELAKELVVQYYNLYVPAKLEPEKAEQLRTFRIQLDQTEAIGAMGMMQGPQIPPQANPQALPTSPLVPNNNVPGAPAAPTA